MKRRLCILIFVLAIISASPFGFAFHYAWWLVLNYEPEATEILSIPVSTIDPSWSYAEAFSKDAIPQEERSDFEKHYEPYGYSFSIEDDFNNDGKKDKAVVGVYKDTLGDTGSFLLILTRSLEDLWVKSFIYKIPNRDRFSILRKQQGHLSWYFCMDCDIYSTIEWKDGTYILVPNDCC